MDLSSGLHLELILVAGALFCLASIACCLRTQDEQEAATDPLPLENKYSDNYALTGDRPEETAENVEKGVVEDDVPNSGRVVLQWGKVDGEFEYWADKAVAYPNLEALARKWALVHENLGSFKERKRVLKEVAAAPDVDPVFATLKTYAPKPLAVEEQANVYKWRGKLRDMRAPLQPEPPKSIRYGDFKKNV
jgi:hypothetical protein